MAGLPVPFDEIQHTVEVWNTCINENWPVAHGQRGGAGTALAEASRRLRIPPGSNTIRKRLDTATALGLKVQGWRAVDPEWAAAQVRRYQTFDEAFQAAEARFPRSGSARLGKSRTRAASPRSPTPDRAPITTVVEAAEPDYQALVDKVVPVLRGKPLTIDEVAAKLQVDPMTAFVALKKAHDQGASIAERAGKWHLDAAPALGINRAMPEMFTDNNGRIRFAACGDQHLCSKYAREDCLEDYYDQVARRDISVVLNAGNWIDGEASFNMHDLSVHGMDAQMQYLARHYPKRAGVETWAITGADHEGWYAKREGVDVGRYAANVMQQNGRTDWRDVGYMESYIRLIHPASGQGSMIHLMHPGGGSAYAVSYAVQKIVEGYDGGDKPAVLFAGHYHKSGYNLIRNVHAMQTGTFQDQTVFMRQRKLAAHVGGCFVELHVDPRTGAVDECSYTFRNYFVRDYYNGRWSQHGAVNFAARVV